VHGLVFTSWLALFFAQVVLVAAHRTDVHRRLGVAGGALAALVAAVGVVTAVVRAKQGAAPPGFPPLAFLAIPLTDMLVDLDDALSRLRAADPAAADLVTMRVFGGMTVEEIAAAQGTSPRTVKRNWAYARAYLTAALADG
jgi:hypothetical protein